MPSNLFHRAGQAPDVHSFQAVALYDPDTGHIRHTHVVTVFAGGRAVPEQDAIEAARRHATRLGHPVDTLRVTVTNHPDHLRRPHRVDPGTGRFVPAPGPGLERRRPPAT